jgi:hypothetical protein
VQKEVPRRLLWFCWLVLRVASLIVPRRLRKEWLQEWHGEVWHWVHFLVESDRLNVRTEQKLLSHCWGAFEDALWHRFNRVAILEFVDTYPTTPGFCLVVIVSALSVLIACSPRSLSWWTFRPVPNVGAANLLTVSPNSRSPWLDPELLQDAVAAWTQRNPLIAQAGTYAWRPSLVRGPAGKEEVLSARVTPGMFALFGVSPILGRTFDPTDPSHCENCVVLSAAIWRSQFHENKQAIGQRLSLNGGQVEIIAVLPAQFRLSGMNIGLFTRFGPGSQPRLPDFEWPGAVLRVPAGLPVGRAKRDLETYVNQTGDLPPNIILDVLSPQDIRYQGLESCTALTGFAVLLLAILNWRSAARLCATGPRRSAADVVRWWLFFVVKSTLLMLIVVVASLDVGQMTVLGFGLETQSYLGGAAIWVFLAGLTIALSWSVRDQHARCRTCLRRLQTQVDLGGYLGAFCEPSGIELICEGGHGILHLPTLQLSSLDSERWTDLDESWNALSGARAGASSL